MWAPEGEVPLKSRNWGEEKRLLVPPHQSQGCPQGTHISAPHPRTADGERKQVQWAEKGLDLNILHQLEAGWE